MNKTNLLTTSSIRALKLIEEGNQIMSRANIRVQKNK